MITIFATPKNFIGIFDTIQLNALRSWRALSPEIEIIIFGDSKGSKEIAIEIQAIFIPEVKCSSKGTPILSDMFLKAQNISKYDIMMFINADIILPNNFLDIIKIVSDKFNKYLMVGHRWDLDVDQLIDFQNENSQTAFWKTVDKNSTKHRCTGIDYFVFNKTLWSILPEFIIGRPGYDNWLIWKARRMLVPVIDASEVVKVVHQNHDFNFHNLSSDPKLIPESEGLKNKELHQGKVLNILDANYFIHNKIIEKKTNFDSIVRYWHRLPNIFPEFSFFIKLFRTIRLKLK